MTNSQTNPRPSARWPNSQARLLRLFCFPYAGGSSNLIYRGWQEGLPESVEVCPVELLGRGRRLRETPFTRLMPLVEAIAGEILPRLDKPFAFFGHSMGATIGFELARLLRREHCPTPVHLFVSGHRAPHIPMTEPPTYNLPEPEFLEELRRLNGTPQEVLEHPELIQMLMPLLRADFEVVQTYTYTAAPPLDCPITAFGGLQDVEVPSEYVAAWRDHSAAAFTLRMLPGGHFFLHTSRSLLLHALAQQLRQLTNTLSPV
jgi:medium-chain acyl-[acyl-carrier-protein] hydrolase